MSTKKNELILKTYELLKTTNPEDVKIRTIASACGCTTPVIYKHFEDLDHLILFASVKFLEDYIIELQDIINTNSDPLEMLFSMWEVFSKYAFANAHVFEQLFWGKYKEGLGDTIFEYYQIFPNEWQNLDGLFTSVFFNNEIRERNYMIMHRAAVKGYFQYEDARMLSDLECSLFHGLLIEYQDCYRQQGKAEEGKRVFMKMLHSLVDRYQISK